MVGMSGDARFVAALLAASGLLDALSKSKESFMKLSSVGKSKLSPMTDEGMLEPKINVPSSEPLEKEAEFHSFLISFPSVIIMSPAVRAIFPDAELPVLFEEPESEEESRKESFNESGDSAAAMSRAPSVEDAVVGLCRACGLKPLSD